MVWTPLRKGTSAYELTKRIGLSLRLPDKREVAETLADLRGSCTVLVVAHRSSTVRAADHVLFLEAGRLVAAGSWGEVRRNVGPRLAALGLLE
jgi:ABC-type transport system involved in Fe-S cluster assembly fused permease/ATPase subunit